MNAEYLILTPIKLENICDSKFTFLSINLAPAELLASEIKNFEHYSSNIVECNPILIEETYLLLLGRISLSLNSLHSIDLTESQWETILGYWLINIVNGVSERWEQLERIESLDVSPIVCIGSRRTDFSPRFKSMEGKNFSEDHDFNSFVYEQLLSYFPSIRRKQFPGDTLGQTRGSSPSPTYSFTLPRFQPGVRRTLKYAFLILSRRLRLKPNIFITASWIPKINYMWTSLFTRRLVFSSENHFSKINSSPTRVDALSWLSAEKSESSFIRACIEIINQVIPSSLVEDFKATLHAIEKAGLNYSPQLVISNQHHCTGSDLQRIWFGIFGNNHNQLTIIQHGGTYGTYKFQWAAYVEMRISRVFMCWGWSALDRSNNRILNTPALRLIKKRKARGDRKISSGKTLILLSPEPGYNSLYLPSQPYGPNEYLRYLYGILELIKTVDTKTSSKFCIRRQNHRNFLTSTFFTTFHPAISEESESQLDFENWDLIVSTYNGTNSLECLLSGKPCIFYWDSNYASFTELSAPIFKRLENVGILHFTPESAKAILEMSENFRKEWWSSPEVTEAVTNFLTFFGNTNGGNLSFSKILSAQISSIDSI